jgi:hypothetical protein
MQGEYSYPTKMCPECPGTDILNCTATLFKLRLEVLLKSMAKFSWEKFCTKIGLAEL